MTSQTCTHCPRGRHRFHPSNRARPLESVKWRCERGARKVNNSLSPPFFWGVERSANREIPLRDTPIGKPSVIDSESDSNRAARFSRRALRAIGACVLAVSFIWLYVASIGQRAPFISRQGDLVRFTDGALYFTAAASFWNSEAADYYSYESQNRICRELTNSDTTRAMLINPLPTALLIFWPLIEAAEGDLPLAHALWMGLSLAMLLYSTVRCCAAMNLFAARAHYPYLAAPLVALFSYATLSAIAIGQTTILSSACFLLLIANSKEGRTDRISVAEDALCVFLCSIKPQFFALGWALAMVLGRARGAWIGVGVTLASWGILTPSLGVGWVQNYLQMLQLYQGSGPQTAYGQGFSLERMNIFVTAFSDLLGQRTAFALTWAALPCIFALGLAAAWRWRDSAQARVCCSLTLLAGYSLFAPHSGFYEEVIWLPVVVLAMLSPQLRLARRLPLLFAVGCAALVVNRMAFGLASESPIAWWTIKVAAAALMLISARPARSETTRDNQLTSLL